MTKRGLSDRHLGADAAVGATLGSEEMTMRYALLMHYREPGEGEISEDAIAEAKEAISWAEKCPGAQWGVIEVRPTATAFVNGGWTR
jgi:hypothetical protein